MRKDSNTKWYALICLAGFILNFIAFYPGFLSPDGLDQYQQSISHHYTDWHPPIMAVLWSGLNKIYNGPASMLFMQLCFLWWSCYLLMSAVNNKIWQAVVVLLTLAPFVQNFSGYIIKDTQMAFSWLLAFAILFKSVCKERRLSIIEIIGCGLLLLYGSMVRPNALPGVFPLCCLLVWVIYKQKSLAVKGVLSVLLFLLMFVAQYLINNVLIQPESQHPEDKLYMHDLTGIFVKTHQNVFPPEVYAIKNFDTGYLVTHYTPATFDNIWGNTDNVHVQVSDTDEPITQQLKAAWMQALKKHPGVYLSNRFEGFLYYLNVKRRSVNIHYMYRSVDVNTYGFTYKPNLLSRLFTDYIVRQQAMPYMQPWFWFVINFILLAFIRKIKNDFLRICYSMLLFSSLLYMLPCFFIFQTDTDFRYFYWNCIACCLAICLLLADRQKRKNILAL